MKNIKRITIYFILFWWATTSFGQGNKSEVVYQSGFEEQPNTIHLKLFNPLVLYDEGIMVYRREENSSQWTKLTDKPVLKGDYTIPAHILSADEQLAEAVEIARHLTADALEDIVKAQVVVEMCRSNEFAKFIGTYVSDPTAVAGVTYRYMIKRIYKGNEIFDVVTKPIRSGEYVPVDPPKEFTVNAKNRKARLRWMVETSRYFGVNIYRKQEDSDKVTKLNEKPVMVSKVPMPDGSWRYPEEFYMDRGIKNNIRYEYFIKGIDFFGFETLPSEVVEVISKNTIPPPAPSMLMSGVKDYVISLKWTMPDSIKAQGLNIYRSPSMNTPFKKVNSELLPLTTTTFEERIEQPGFYYYYVATIGSDSLEGKSNYTMTEIKDVVPPPIPVNLYAEADTACIRLSWDAVTDNDLMGYRVYRTIQTRFKPQYVLLNADPVWQTNYTDSLPFNARNKFQYVVVAVDSSYNMSDYSEFASAKMPDIVPPDKPFIKKVSSADNGLLVEWLPNIEPDLKGYLLMSRMSDDSTSQLDMVVQEIIDGGTQSFIHTNIQPKVRYEYVLVAIDSSGNKSLPSDGVKGRKVFADQDEEELSMKITSFNYSAEDKSLTIRWNQRSGKPLKGAVVFCQKEEGEDFKPCSGMITSGQWNTTLKEKGSLVYKVKAFDNEGNKWESRVLPLIVE